MKKSKAAAPSAARLEPAGHPANDRSEQRSSRQPPPGAIALRLAATVGKAPKDWIYVASSERRAEEIARALADMSTAIEVLYLPGWDCLPFDRAAPSPEIMGKRMRVLRNCKRSSKQSRVLVLSAEALIQKLPPPAAVDEVLELRVGEPLDREAFERFALRTGYSFDDRVDEPGEIAMRGNVVEVFAAHLDEPIRIVDATGVIESMRHYDPLTQRSLKEVPRLELGPASELVVGPEERGPGEEHRMSEHYGELVTIFDYLPKARLLQADTVPLRIDRLYEQIAEAHATVRDLGDQRPVAISDLYLDDAGRARLRENKNGQALQLDDIQVVPDFAGERHQRRALADFVRAEAEKNAIVLCGTSYERERLRSLLRRSDIQPTEMEGSLGDLRGQKGVWFADLDIETGFCDQRQGICVIAAADVLDSRLNGWRSDGSRLLAPLEMRVGDVVVHEGHGVGVLRDLTLVKADGIEQDTIKLEYHGGATMMVPVADFGKLWRYGAEADAVELDRLNTDAWAKKRASVSDEVNAAAHELVELAERRLALEALALRPPRAAAERLAQRFPYTETPDQTAAINAVLDDMASGHPMNRLICGDVGFGKTEVALRAAAAAALCGAQVAVVAPTTVLASQHLQSFEQRFAGTEITVGMLSGLNTAAESAATKEQLRTGALQIVVGTHAIAAEDVAFQTLGLVVVDEEQRFGAKLKRHLEEMARECHLLSLTATPIPRSLQSALVGLQDVSILATPPARRRPIRTFVVPFDLATARTALLREKRRGGQSFIVVPRIGDIEEVAEKLAEVVPELKLLIAHGDLPPKETDARLLAFANGDGDILLATSIIESGLDVPRANTMLVWRADRFGLSQLHQLRGRVGRGRAQGVAYLFTDRDEELSDATRSRLSTLEAFDRLGSGFEISSRDLELRGAGELLGEEQAGHLHLIGAGLYQRLLERALAAAKGESTEAIAPAQLNVGLVGHIPSNYVPEAAVRINLYARLQRIDKVYDLEGFAEELADRFGPMPNEVDTLLLATHVALEAGSRGVARVDAGPLGIALTFRTELDRDELAAKLSGEPRISGTRVTLARREGTAVLDELAELLSCPR